MDNKFDSANYPTTEPSKITQGQWVAWKRDDITNAYPTATYTLKYIFQQLDGNGFKKTVTADKVSSEHVVTLAIADTPGFPPGEYYWTAIVVRDSDSESVDVDKGRIEFVASSGDVRSWNLQVYQAIKSTIAGTATKEEASYSVAGRSLSRRSISELLELEKEFKRRVEEEQTELDIEAGRSTDKPRVYIKMNA